MITSQMAGINVYASQVKQHSSGLIAEGKDSKNNSANSTEETSPKSAVDTVSISNAALQVAKNSVATTSSSYYEQFMPTYEGFSAANIAAGVSAPNVDTFSAGKDFDQVAKDARASLDKNYERLESIGKPFNASSSQAVDRSSLLGELDRRALYAVVSNEGGLFTKDEQDVARNKMSQQVSLAMGMYSGPISEEDKFIDPFMGDKAQKYKAGIQFLDQVSNEEKGSSITFAHQRASLQKMYENVVTEQGGTPEDLTSDNSLVNLILEAMNSADGDLKRGQTFGSITNLDDLKRQPWFEPFADRLDNIIDKTKDLYLGDN